VVWLLGSIPLLAVDYAIQSSPVVMPMRRTRDLAAHGLVVAMGLAIVFPLNFVAKERKERWDLAYFKTPAPGTATHALVGSLERPVKVRIFMPPSSEVGIELQNYFSELDSPNLTVEVLDQAADPALAQELRVRDNGSVVFTAGEDEETAEGEAEQADDANAEATAGEPEADKAKQTKPISRTLQVEPEFDKAKRTLKKLDQEVQRILHEIGHGKRIAYVVHGHGELDWQGKLTYDLGMKALEARLRELGFSVRRLSVKTGLAEKVPEEADLVAVLGPMHPYSQAEVDALKSYLYGGGALLIALEPAILRARPDAPEPLEDFIVELGIRLGDGVLASERAIIPLQNNKADRLNVVTNSFTSHPSIATVSKEAQRTLVFNFAAGYLEDVEDTPNKVTVTVRSDGSTWADLDRDLDFNADQGESKQARAIAAAITGGDEEAPWRAIVTSDATMFSDLGLALRIGGIPSGGNYQLATDMFNWLVGTESLTGTTENEEDVKIEHTKGGQATWFYLTVLCVPLLVLGAGAVRIRLRRTGRPFTKGAKS
jgi:hypothetical protein